MEVGNIGSMKTKLKSLRTTGNLNTISIPTSTPHCVIIKSCKAPLPKPIGPVKYRTQFDYEFPLFLRGKIDEEEFKHTLDGINWFALLLHEAEIEFCAEKNMLSEIWKSSWEWVINEEKRRKVIHEMLRKRGIDPPPYRERIRTERELKEFQDKCSQWIQKFIDDENESVYIHKGVQWYNPDKNLWRWVEVQISKPTVSDDDKINKVSKEDDEENLDSVEKKKKRNLVSPEFGQKIEFNIRDTIDMGGHTEYFVSVQTNISDWYPYSTHFVLRRYNEFKAFYETIKQIMNQLGIDANDLLPFPEAKVIGRKSKSTVSKRANIFQGILTFIANDNRLNTRNEVFDFFGINPSPESWKYMQYVDGNVI